MFVSQFLSGYFTKPRSTPLSWLTPSKGNDLSKATKMGRDRGVNGVVALQTAVNTEGPDNAH